MVGKVSNHRLLAKDEERQDAGNKTMSKSGQGHEENKKSPAESHPPWLLPSVLRRRQVSRLHLLPSRPLSWPLISALEGAGRRKYLIADNSWYTFILTTTVSKITGCNQILFFF